MRRTEVTIHPDYNSSINVNDIALSASFYDLFKQRTLVEYNVTRAHKRDCIREHKGNFSASHMLCFKKSQCSDNAVGLIFRNNMLSTFGLKCLSDGE